jgi:hypothetical protein
MRDLTKSMLSFSWVMPLFGMKQMLDIAMPSDPSRPFGRTTDSFETVTRATQDQLGGAWNSAFRAGDQLQRGMVDLMFSFLSLDALNPNRMMQMSSDVMQRSMGAAGQMAGAATNMTTNMTGQMTGAATGMAGQMAGAATSAAQGAWPGTGPATFPQQAPAGWPAAAAAAEPSTSEPVGPPPGWKVSTPNF